MDSFYTFNAVAVNYTLPVISETPNFTEAVPLTFNLAAAGEAGDEVDVPLTGLTAPKLLVVKGAKGIVVILNEYGEVHEADPLFVQTNKTTGMSISGLTIVNTDTVPHIVTVLAAE